MYLLLLLVYVSGLGGIWLGGIDIVEEDGKCRDIVFGLLLVTNFFYSAFFVSSIREWDGSGMFLICVSVVRRICEYIRKLGKRT